MPVWLIKIETRGAAVKSSKKIVFFVPSFSSIEATAPLGLLAISTPLLEAGYEIRIIDATITPDYKQRILEEVKDALCLGISVVTGPMIKDTVDVAKAVKKWDPEFPIILGGWHPSLLPTQTLEADYVDIVFAGRAKRARLQSPSACGTMRHSMTCSGSDSSRTENFISRRSAR